MDAATAINARQMVKNNYKNNTMWRAKSQGNRGFQTSILNLDKDIKFRRKSHGIF